MNTEFYTFLSFHTFVLFRDWDDRGSIRVPRERRDDRRDDRRDETRNRDTERDRKKEEKDSSTTKTE